MATKWPWCELGKWPLADVGPYYVSHILVLKVVSFQDLKLL